MAALVLGLYFAFYGKAAAAGVYPPVAGLSAVGLVLGNVASKHEGNQGAAGIGSVLCVLCLLLGGIAAAQVYQALRDVGESFNNGFGQ